MPEIGATLREARMRSRIDISEIESQTKIRAKYLRALENEEWDLLPGPTYVKSFLRTYADALHLDGKRLVEEYKLQHERLSDVELQPIAPPGRRGEPPRSRGPSRLLLAGAALVVLVAALYFLGRGSDDDGGGGGSTVATTAAEEPAKTTSDRGNRRRRAATARRVRLQVVPTAPVYVCLVADGKPVISQQVLQAGDRSRTYRAKRFEITLGNGSANLRVNGKTFDVPDSANPLGYRFTSKGRTELTEAQRPTCG